MMTNNIETIKRELSDGLAEVDRAKISLSRLEGQESELLRQLKTVHKLDSIEAAEKEVKKLDVQIIKKTEEIASDFTTLKEKFDW